MGRSRNRGGIALALLVLAGLSSSSEASASTGLEGFTAQDATVIGTVGLTALGVIKTASPIVAGSPLGNGDNGNSGAWSTSPTGRVDIFQPGPDCRTYQANDSAVNKGGAVDSQGSLVLLFWGTYWNNSENYPSRWWIQQMVQAWTSGAYFRELGQYGIQPPKYYGAWVIPSDPPPSVGGCPGGPNDAIIPMINGELQQGGIPGLNNNSANLVFVVVTPPYTAPPPNSPDLNSCHQYSAHNCFLGICSGPQSYAYAWAYLHTVGANTQGLDPDAPMAFATMEDISHEVVESLSDYDAGNDGWVLQTPSCTIPAEFELADGCGFFGIVDGVWVRSYWSNAVHACVVPYPGPPTVTSISVGSGPLAGGTTTTVHGTGFDIFGYTQVSIGGQVAQVVGAPCPNAGLCVGSGFCSTSPMCCESTTSCTVITPPSVAPVSCNQNNPVQAAPVQVIANWTVGTGDLQYYYSETAACVGAACGPNEVFDTAGLCVPIGSACGNLGYVIAQNGQCAALGTVADCKTGMVLGQGGVCVTPGTTCVVNGDACGTLSAYGECYVGGAACNTCPAGEVQAGNQYTGYYCTFPSTATGGNTSPPGETAGGGGTTNGGGTGGGGGGTPEPAPGHGHEVNIQ